LLGENVWFGEEAIHVLSGGTSGRPFSRSGEQVARNQRHSSLQQRLTAQPNQQSFKRAKPSLLIAMNPRQYRHVADFRFTALDQHPIPEHATFPDHEGGPCKRAAEKKSALLIDDLGWKPHYVVVGA
jgi:hypothetical protein